MPSWTEPQLGQWFTSPDGTRWWFDSGSIALDFAYTGAMGDNPAWEFWHRPADVTLWLEDRFGQRITVTTADFERVLELRAAVAHLVMDACAGRRWSARHRSVLNRYAAQPDVVPQLDKSARATLDQALATLAREAIRVLRDQSARVRECTAGDCQVVYVDTSRSGNRTWCSMSRCGNRHKVRQLRARQKHDP